TGQFGKQHVAIEAFYQTFFNSSPLKCVFVVIATPSDKHAINIILTHLTSLIITQGKGCEARHYLFLSLP
ncbi:hypothetical protein, partial [Pseudomonas aeruginosa]|uniref:hypothetical protein n=1 Tax=Pseudomonas aeruginosa TaxID=287 RepID=UPI0031B6C978